jgi:putative DNA primase/helicase
MTECSCGRPLITFPDDMQPTCPECQSLPVACDCGHLAEELPGPSNPMAVARILIEDYRSQGDLTLRRWRGTWMEHQRTHWAEAEDAAIRESLYMRLEHAVYEDASGRKPVTRQWEPNRRKVSDLQDAIAATVHLAASTNAPAWIGGPGPVPAGEVVSCSNGLLHVGTRKLIDHTPRFFGTVAVPFAYDPAAPKPEKWLEFLDDIWQDDPEAITALQEWFGYILSGRTDLHKIMMLIGPTRSGKGTIARVLTALLGDGNTAGPTLASLGTNFGLQPLLGKPLALVSDARLGGNESEVVERLLSVSGEDALTVDRKYREPWTGKLAARFMILSNELPRFGDASGAIARRFVILVMNKSFLGKEDSALTGKLLAELPGILSWALDGLDRLLRTGRLTSPASSEDAIVALQDLVSPVSAFVRDWCETGAVQIRVTDLFDAWKAWAEANNQRPGSTATFGRNLHAVVPALRVAQPRVEGSRGRIYVGITLNGTGFGVARVPPVPARASDESGTGNEAVARDGTGNMFADKSAESPAGKGLARDGTRGTGNPERLSSRARTDSSSSREDRFPDLPVPRVPRVPGPGQSGSEGHIDRVPDPVPPRARCADPSCRAPLDAALIKAEITAHPSCHDPAEAS